MTKKDYELIARVFQLTRHVEGTHSYEQWKKTVVAMANALKSDNSRFNFTTFYKACGIEVYEP
jgi:hypothetical protein